MSHGLPADCRGEPICEKKLPGKAATFRGHVAPAGALHGFCSVPIEGRGPLPQPQPIDLEKGPHAIRKPGRGEVDYYREVE